MATGFEDITLVSLMEQQGAAESIPDMSMVVDANQDELSWTKKSERKSRKQGRIGCKRILEWICQYCQARFTNMF